MKKLALLIAALATLAGCNTIAGVETFGVLVASLESGVRISRNAIYDC